MNEARPNAQDILQAFRAFMDSRGVQLTDPQSGLFHAAVADILGAARPRGYLTLELDGKVWTLIVVDDDVRLVKLEDAAEIRYLGPLRGSYSEQMTIEQMANGQLAFKIGLRFKVTDPRFPGGCIELELLPTPPGGFVSDLEAQREEMIRTHLRPWLRARGDKSRPPETTPGPHG